MFDYVRPNDLCMTAGMGAENFPFGLISLAREILLICQAAPFSTALQFKTTAVTFFGHSWANSFVSTFLEDPDLLKLKIRRLDPLVSLSLSLSLSSLAIQDRRQIHLENLPNTKIAGREGKKWSNLLILGG